MRTSTQDLRGENVIDSRDVIARIADLEDEVEDLFSQWLADRNDGKSGAEVEEETPELRETFMDEHQDEDPVEELRLLKALEEEASGYSDWLHGATLIRDSYFTEYAEQLAEDLGYTNRNTSWPYTCIDWDKAADQLKQDYMSVSFADEDYWIR